MERFRNAYAFDFRGERLHAHPGGVLLWGDRDLLVVSDLHLGKSERMARRGGAFLPPYDTLDTLARLDELIQTLDPAAVICLGDSFDDDAAAEGLTTTERLVLGKAMAGRRWVWVEGNHDPSAGGYEGDRCAELAVGPMVFRHIAEPDAAGEVSGHYHPKATVSARGARMSRPCFLIDGARIVMPAFGTYTGGLASHAPELDALMGAEAVAVLTGGARAVAMPMRPLPQAGRRKSA